MIWGVTYEFVVINLMFCWVAFINTQNFLAVFMAVPLHLICYLICMKEPRMIQLLALRGSRGYKSWNNMLGYHFNTNSYDVF